MMNNAVCKMGANKKGRAADLWGISLIVIFQVMALVLFSMATPGPVEAKTFTVNSTLDEVDASTDDGICSSTPSNVCTLRAAIQQANALAGRDVAKLKAGLYMLTIPGTLEDACATGDLDITEDLSITGPGSKNTFINGGKLDRVFHIISGTVTIADVTIQNGLATDGPDGGGGGIFNQDGVLTLKGVTVSNNIASEIHAHGGGIYNLGTLTITKSPITYMKSTISRNLAGGRSSYGYGGGISNGGTLTIKGNTLLSSNTVTAVECFGGAVYNSGTLNITKSTLSDNTASSFWGGATGYGGGIANEGTCMVTGSTISNNLASRQGLGGGIYNAGLLTVEESTVFKNTATGTTAWGGGICIVPRTSPISTTVKGSTVSGNSAIAVLYGVGEAYSYGSGGGIYYSSGVLLIEGSTISNNVVSGTDVQGAGIYAWGSNNANVTVDSSTISGNSASGWEIAGNGGGVFMITYTGLPFTLTVRNGSKIIKNFSSDPGGGIAYVGAATGTISSDSTVSANIPDNFYTEPLP